MRGTNLRLGRDGNSEISNQQPKYDLYVGHLFPETPPVQDEVSLGSSIPRLVGDQVFRFLLEPCFPDNKLISKCKL